MVKRKTTVKKHNKPEKVFSFVALDGKTYKLTIREKKFCEFYILLDGCGADAYEEAGYECKNRNVSKAGAYQLGVKEHINAYINKLLNDQGFEDNNVAKQHLFLINQHADLASKSKGVDMYYKLSGKYAAEKLKFIDEYGDLTDEEVEDKLAEIRRRREGLLEKSNDERKTKPA